AGPGDIGGTADENCGDERASVRTDHDDCARRAVSFYPEPDVSRADVAPDRRRVSPQRRHHAPVRRCAGADLPFRRDPARGTLPRSEVRRGVSRAKTKRPPPDLTSEADWHLTRQDSPRFKREAFLMMSVGLIFSDFLGSRFRDSILHQGITFLSLQNFPV